MPIVVKRTDLASLAELRERYRAEADCQIVHHSILPRGMADPFAIEADGRLVGYGGVWNTIEPGMLMEFYVLPEHRPRASEFFRALVAASGADRMEAQTNMPLMHAMLREHTADPLGDRLLFADGYDPCLERTDVVFRPSTPAEREFDGDPNQWVLERDGGVVARGGSLCHYNPPYADVYMSVEEAHRRCGYGAFLVQEIKRACHAAGKRPAARCQVENVASRRTLERAGFVVVGELRTGRLVGVAG